jgi:hypothetical protein
MEQTMDTRYYVTNEGLSAAISDQAVLDNLRGILRGTPSDRGVLARYVKQGLLAKDKRRKFADRVDHTDIILNGHIERLIAAMPSPKEDTPVVVPKANGKAKPVKAAKPRQDVSGRRPFALYAAIVRRTLPVVPPSALKVYEALKGRPEPLSTEQILALPELAPSTPTTIRWAIQVLRTKGLVETVPTPGAAPEPDAPVQEQPPQLAAAGA